jgi:broad specificity phosphatase PhoE
VPADTVFVALARHGETRVPDSEGRFTSRPGPLLTPRGLDQARRLGEWLRPFDVAHLYCSDLPRAMRSAEIVAAALGLEPEPVEDLREIYSGDLNGATLERVEREHPRHLPWIHVGHRQGFATEDFHVPHDLAFPGGESIDDMAARAVPAFARMCAASLGSLIVVISHAWVTSVLTCHVLGLPTSAYFRLASPNCAVTLVQVDATGRGMVHCLNGQVPLTELARAGLPRAQPQGGSGREESPRRWARERPDTEDVASARS